MHAMPLYSICYKICRGILLIPELLLALNAFYSVLLSSAGVMCCVSADLTGSYYSGCSDGSKNSLRL